MPTVPRWQGISREPLETPPPGYMPEPAQLDMLERALIGVELGAYDKRMLRWLAGMDLPTVGTIASLIVRAREAGVPER